MRSIYLFVCLCIIFQISFSQENQTDYFGQLVKSVAIPKSPEAAAFEKYGNQGVSMYAGTPNISIPIYTIAGKEMSLPISLSYDASGIKVQQLASQVGLGWNLNVGGRISRVINGLPDDNIDVSGNYASILTNGTISASEVRNKILSYAQNSGVFSSIANGLDYLRFLNDVNTNKIDAEPDYYSLNALGISDNIIFKFDTQSLTAKTLSNPRIHVKPIFSNNRIIKWIVTNEDGSIFYFDLYEQTKTLGNDAALTSYTGVYKEYISSWVLTKIISPNKKDTFELSYTTFPYWSDNAKLPATATSVTNKIQNDVFQYSGIDSQTSFIPEYNIQQVYLNKITHNGRIAVTFELGAREDVSINSALQSITIYDFDYTIGSPAINHILKRYQFQHSYFGTYGPLHKDYEVRLKLDKIAIMGSDLNTYTSYDFDYFSPASVPSRISLAQDYLGYFNGINNQLLYPDVTLSGGYHFAGANRNVNFNKAKVGTLQKIHYPTGGTTEFIYEPHTFTAANNTNPLLRVHKGGCSVSSTLHNTSEAGWCIYETASGPTSVQTCTFEITDTDYYDITFGGGNGMAFIHQLSGQCTQYSDTPINDTPPFIVECLNYQYTPIDTRTLCPGNTSGSVWEATYPYDSTNPYGSDGKVHLAAGVYQISMFNTSDLETTLTLDISRMEADETPTVNGSPIPAGLRIQKLIDDPGTGEPPITKTYKYITDINGTESSGKIIYSPHLYTTDEVYYLTGANDNNPYSLTGYTSLNRVASAPGGSQPHIAYQKVYELQENNGYTEHVFNTGRNGIITAAHAPFSNSFESNYKVGKEKQRSSYTQTQQQVTKTESTYYTNLTSSSLGYAIRIDASKTYHYAYFELINGMYNLDYVEGSHVPFGATGPPTNYLPNLFCGNPNITCIDNRFYGPLRPFTTVATGRMGNVIQQINTSYYSDGDQTQTVDYHYAANGLLKETISRDSEDNIVKTVNSYPEDYPDTTVYDDMVNDHILSPVIKTETYYNNEKTTTQETSFKKWGNYYLPEYLQASKGSLPLEKRLQYHSYYTNGNVKEVSLKNGPKTVYIWGYKEQYPIAKIENATYAQVAGQVANLQNKSNADTDRTIGNTGNEGALRMALTGLRNSLPNALVTTFTYDPLIGVTSITDPSGQIVYYHYDGFNRLKYVMDKDGKILSKNEYNYKSQN